MSNPMTTPLGREKYTWLRKQKQEEDEWVHSKWSLNFACKVHFTQTQFRCKEYTDNNNQVTKVAFWCPKYKN